MLHPNRVWYSMDGCFRQLRLPLRCLTFVLLVDGCSGSQRSCYLKVPKWRRHIWTHRTPRIDVLHETFEWEYWCRHREMTMTIVQQHPITRGGILRESDKTLDLALLPGTTSTTSFPQHADVHVFMVPPYGWYAEGVSDSPFSRTSISPAVPLSHPFEGQPSSVSSMSDALLHCHRWVGT